MDQTIDSFSSNTQNYHDLIDSVTAASFSVQAVLYHPHIKKARASFGPDRDPVPAPEGGDHRVARADGHLRHRCPSRLSPAASGLFSSSRTAGGGIGGPKTQDKRFIGPEPPGHPLFRIVAQQQDAAALRKALWKPPGLFSRRKRADDQHAFRSISALVHIQPAPERAILPVVPLEQCGAAFAKTKAFPMKS